VTDCSQESVNEVKRINGEPFSCQIHELDLFLRKQLRNGDSHARLKSHISCRAPATYSRRFRRIKKPSLMLGREIQ
jgi:hypothetical protein